MYRVQTACAQDASPVYWRINQATVDEKVTGTVTSSVAPNQTVNRPVRSWLGLPDRLLESSSAERRRIVIYSQSGLHSSAWDNRTGYLARTNGLDRFEIAAVLKIPSSKGNPQGEDLALARLCNLCLICMEATRRSTAYGEQVRWKYRAFNGHTSRLLVSAEQERMSLKPLRYIQTETAREYFGTWCQFLCYVYRTWRGSPFANRAEPLFVLSDGQKDALTCITDRLTHRSYDQSLDDPRLFMQDSTEVVRFMREDPLVREFFALSSAFVEERYRLSFLETGLLSFSALKNIRPCGSTMVAAEASGLLSRIIYCCQLVVIGYLWSHESDDEAVVNLLEGFQEAYMSTHTRTPLGELQSQRLFAIRVGKTEPSMPDTYWVDGSVVVHRDIRLETNRLEGFVRSLTERAVKVWNRLVFDTTVPELNLKDYKTVADNMGNRSAAYSGLTDVNGKVKDAKDLFLQDFLGKFFDPNLNEERNNRNLFTPAWVHSYEQTVEEFLGLVLLLVHICAGQPARGPEILSTRYSNDQSLRNLFVYDGTILISICYHKSQSLTQQQR